MSTAWLVAGAVFVLAALAGYVAFWIVLDIRERRALERHRLDLIKAAELRHRQRQDAGRYLTDDPRRPE